MQSIFSRIERNKKKSNKKSSSTSIEEKLEIELTKYISLDPEDLKSDPIKWWCNYLLPSRNTSMCVIHQQLLFHCNASSKQLNTLSVMKNECFSSFLYITDEEKRHTHRKRKCVGNGIILGLYQ